MDDTRTFVGTYMLTAGSTFFIPFLATSKSRVTKAQANMALYGGGMGILHGILLHGLLDGREFFDSQSERILTTTLLTSVGEGIAGYMIAGANNLSEGKANVITTVGSFGLGAGAAIGYLADVDDFQGYSGLMLLGTGAGFVAGTSIANTQQFTAGDAEVFAVAGSLGTYVPAALLYAFGADDDGADLLVGTALAGTAGGLYAGSQLVKGHDFTDAEGDYIALGTIAGGALGVGVAYLMSGNDP
jgi:hypothetical protein